MEAGRTSRVGAAVAAVAGAVVLVAGTSAAGAKPTIRASANATLGTILVGATGLTLYHYADDHGKVVRCTGTCTASWRPVVIAATAKPVAGRGLSSAKLGTVKRPDGTVQVTYNGYALYRFAGDTRAGQVNGQGVEKEWYAIAPTGAIVKLAPQASSSSGAATVPASTVPSSSSSSSSGGGYDYGY